MIQAVVYIVIIVEYNTDITDFEMRDLNCQETALEKLASFSSQFVILTSVIRTTKSRENNQRRECRDVSESN